MIEIGAELQRLQSRLAELDQERALVQSEMERLLTELGRPPDAVTPPPARVAAPIPLFTRDKILATINANPEKTFTGADLVRIWKSRGGGATLMGFHSALSRLAAQKKIRRVKMGVYGALR